MTLCAVWGWLIWCLWSQWSFYESYQYGLFVPFLTLSLCWKRWTSAPEPGEARAGLVVAILLAVASLPLFPARLILEASSLWPTICWPISLVVVGTTLGCAYCVGGTPWLRHFSFPILFFLAAIPWPGELERRLINPLTLLNTRVTVEALMVLGVPAIQNGSTIQLASQQVGVDEACSGIRSFHSTLMISLFLGELYLLSRKRRLALVGGGLFLAFGLNVGRTLALSWVGASLGLAGMSRWHDPLGVGVALMCFVGVCVLGMLLRPRAAQVSGGENSSPRPTQRSILPRPLPRFLCLWLVGWMVFLEGGTQAWFYLREARMPTSVEWSVELPNAITALDAPESFKILQRSYRADEIASGSWSESDGSRWHAYYLRWKSGSKTSQAAKGHWPEFCMSNAGNVLRAPPVTKHFRVGGVDLPFRSYVFDRDAEAIYLFHCVWEERSSQSSKLNLHIRQNFLSRIQAAWDGKRNLGQQLFEVFVTGYDSPAAAEAAFEQELQKLVKVRKVAN